MYQIENPMVQYAGKKHILLQTQREFTRQGCDCVLHRSGVHAYENPRHAYENPVNRNLEMSAHSVHRSGDRDRQTIAPVLPTTMTRRDRERGKGWEKRRVTGRREDSEMDEKEREEVADDPCS